MLQEGGTRVDDSIVLVLSLPEMKITRIVGIFIAIGEVFGCRCDIRDRYRLQC